MQNSNTPTKVVVPWANSATLTRPISNTSLIGVHDGWASFPDGFPPLTAVPTGGGGVPPFIQDHNGILNQVTSWDRWQAAGGPVFFDSAFSAAVGGYPKGARLAAVTSGAAGREWVSLVDNNTDNPDAGISSNWIASSLADFASFFATVGVSSPGGIQLLLPTPVESLSMLTGVPISFVATQTNTGSVIVQINSLTPTPTILQGGTTLTGGEILAGWTYTVIYVIGSFWLMGSGAGSVNVNAASEPGHAVNLGQADARYAALNGNIADAFSASDLNVGLGLVGTGSSLPLRNNNHTSSVNAANSGYVQHFAAPATDPQATVNLGQFGLTGNSQRLPNGAFFQFGTNTVGSPSSVVFPTAFPNVCLGLVVCEAGANSSTWGTGGPTTHGYNNLTRSGFQAWGLYWTGTGWSGGSFAQAYVAIGF